MADTIYLDYNATTPCDPRVVQAMAPLFTDCFANPTSRSHRPGRDAYMALETARMSAAACLGARSATEIVFTSGATEANNIAILGLAGQRGQRCRHLVSQVTEHASVTEPLKNLERQGWELSLVGVDSTGVLRLDALEEALRDDTALVSLMLANNETGTIQPLEQATELAHRKMIPVHCDAAQGIGKIPVDVAELGVDLLSLSGHKLCGPKGAGALYMAKGGVTPGAIVFGGGQERGLRSGTVNLPAVVGLARALELAREGITEEAPRVAALRDLLETRILAGLDGCTVNGATDHRLPGTTNLSFAGIDAEALLASLPDVAVSSGSACTSSSPEPSAVLRAMGMPKKLAAASLRISAGRFTTEEEIERAAERIVEEVTRLRNLAGRRRSR